MSRLLFLICVLLSFITSAQNTLTLQETIELALENNYGIRIARSNQEIADNNYTLGNAGFLPIVSVSFNKSFGVQDFERTLASGTDQSET